MRDITFRGKAVMSIEGMGEMGINHERGWVTGNLIANNGNPFIVGDLVEVDSEYIVHEFWVKAHPKSVGQYTGLKDELGRDIYEGDIVTYTDGHDGFTAVVEQDYWQWYLKGIDVIDNFDFADYADKNQTDLMVIGNIHENPELLEVQK